MTQTFLGFDPAQAWDYENGFYLTSHTTRIAKLAAHYELYKSIIGLPGEVVELGVYKGASLVRFATFREILESPYSRKIIGFDAFGKFPEQGDRTDREFISSFEGAGGEGIPIDELRAAFERKGMANIQLIKGDIAETVPAAIAANPALKIALLHIDVDVYEPTVTALTFLFDRVVSGGLVVLDDYGTVAGETRGVDEFFREKGVRIEKLPIAHIPAFIRIP